MAMFSCQYEGEELQFTSLKSFISLLLKNGVKCQEHKIEMSLPLGARSEPETSTENQSDEVEVVRQWSALPIKSLKDLLKDEHVDLNEAQPNTGLSMLMYACLDGREDSVKLLIKKGASLSLVDNNGWSALHYAVWGQNLSCIKAILSASPPTLINVGDSHGVTPLMIAVNRGGLRIIQALIKKGGNPLAIDANERTILHWAITSKQVSLVKFLLDKHLTVAEHRLRADSDGATPLHYAAVMGADEILDLLLSEGFDPSVQDSHSQDQYSFLDSLANGLTPMHWACAMSSENTVTALLSHQGNLVNSLTWQHLTPLHVGACVGSVELCEKLIKEGAMVNARDSCDVTPLHLASHQGHLGCVKLLIEKSADIDALTKTNNCTGLHLASQKGHEEVVDCLLNHGSSRDRASGVERNSPIHLGAIHGNTKVIEILLRHDCSVDLLRETDGRTSLHLSASHGHIECCRLLLEGGANVNKQDTTIESLGPLDIAWLNNQVECSNFLLSHGARTLGGRIHRAACTIQLSWRFHVHKRRRQVTEDWAAHVLQYSIRQWMMRQRARRLMRARERRRGESARIIQHGWKEYLNRKRELEKSYLALKTKLSHEHMATHLIVSELSRQESSINLPPLTATLQHHASISTSTHGPTHSLAPPLPRTAHLLRTSTQPAPLFPVEELLFQQRPKKPLLKQQGLKVRINTVPTTATIGNDVRKDSYTAPALVKEENSSNHLPVAAAYIPSLLDQGGASHHSQLNRGGASYPIVANSVSELISPRRQIKKDDSLSEQVQRGSPSHPSSLEPIIKSSSQSEAIQRHESDMDQQSYKVKLPVMGSSTSKMRSIESKPQDMSNSGTSTALPPLSEPSSSLVTKKHGEDSRDRLTGVSKRKDSLGVSHKKKASPRRHSKQKRDNGKAEGDHRERRRDDFHTNGASKGSQDETLLLQHAQRYDKLQQVALLLEQAKSIHSLSGGNGGSYNELKSQIQSALEEAIRLRVDTEALYDKGSIEDSKIK